MSRADVVIVGAGAFGTALACVIARNGVSVNLVSRDASRAADISGRRENIPALPGIALPPGVTSTADQTVVAETRRILLAVPAQAQAATAAALAGIARPEAELVICAKGLDRDSEGFLSSAVAKAAPRCAVSVLSGPGFAAEIARGLPTAMALANREMERAEETAAALSGETFRLYASDDVAGVEIGGALKNVLAIAAGIVDGAELGQSARAALISRGLAELKRFAVAHGGRAETVSGLSGLGDLVLTATSDVSRNYRFGRSLGSGRAVAELREPGQPLSEGAFTAAIAVRMALSARVEMPITDAVAAILEGEIGVNEAIAALMRRPLQPESSRRPA